MKIRRALISVYNKQGIIEFCKVLSTFGTEIIATKGTFTFLKEAGIPHLTRVSEVTNFPEILTGRVKTVHPHIVGGILAQKEKNQHMKELKRLGIQPIDMVVCNFFPISNSIGMEHQLEPFLENIDIGGPNIIRAAAKNPHNVIVLVNPNRYAQVIQTLKELGDVGIKIRLLLASEAFKEIARYDSIISNIFEQTSWKRLRS
jgi:phosphoribosylaminoimidazolecarboxamide formyltransferase/IMP cyclohydrolase